MKNIARIGYSFFKIGLYGKVFRLSGKEWILSTKNKEDVKRVIEDAKWAKEI
jgi:hypothetical protein|tara:strand:+ start:457 stop:612 length:156 start_codon:yes stop_codon:yes gene_type:complete